MKNVHLVEHPLIHHKLSLLRSKSCGPKDFRNLIIEIATLLTYEACSDFKTKEIDIETPLAVTKGQVLSGKKVGIVAILRAGLGMVDGVLHVFPNAKIGLVGVYRNEETLAPVQYYVRYLDKLAERNVIVVDPMLATGNTATFAIDLLKKKGALKISFLGILASKQGAKCLSQAHPDVDIYLAGIDESLNDSGYILPGLGDAGDRIFGTVQNP